jgi:hypothetical protein
MSTEIYIQQCQHIRCNGLRCGSPALRGKNHCHYHTSLRAIPHQTEIAQVEDATSIQVALMQVIRGISRGTWDTRSAALLLYGLQIASSNYPHVLAEAPSESASYHLPAPDELDECDDPSQELSRKKEGLNPEEDELNPTDDELNPEEHASSGRGLRQSGKLPPASVPEASTKMDAESKGLS